MAASTLVDVPIDDGRRLISALERDGLAIPVAFWLYSSEWGEWRLALASSHVDRFGPREMYRRVQDVMRTIPNFRMRLDQVWAVGLKNSLVKSLRNHFRTGHDLAEVRLTGSMFDGNLFEDAYIYRSA